MCLSAKSADPANRSSDHLHPAITKPVGAAYNLKLLLLNGNVKDRCGRFQLGDVVDHVLPNGMSSALPARCDTALTEGAIALTSEGKSPGSVVPSFSDLSVDRPGAGGEPH
jgi:hypothetical protein